MKNDVDFILQYFYKKYNTKLLQILTICLLSFCINAQVFATFYGGAGHVTGGD